MKLVIYPSVESPRLEKIRVAAGEMEVVRAEDEGSAADETVLADAFFGKMTPAILERAQKLRWVQAPTASLEHFIFPELVEHPCVLTNMRGLFSDVIADHVFGFMLCFARNLHRYIRQQIDSHWAPIGGAEQRPAFVPAGAGVTTAIDRAHFQLADCTLGVVGLGGIGAEVARRGGLLGMRVLGLDPAIENAPEGVVSVWPPERLDELLEESDFVVIAAPHTPKTAGMFRTPQFGRMKKSAYLINIGRGVIVDLDELVDSLESGEIAGAGLDVFETEPLPSDHPLWRMENVIITPHVAAASIRIAERHLDLLLENIRRFTRGEQLTNVADKESWY